MQKTKVEQFVMAYSTEHDRLRAVMPEGFTSLRPVLRINAEILNSKTGYIEFNTAVEKDGKKGWLNIAFWNDVPFERNGKTVVFNTEFLNISFTEVGVEGACPAEKDNDGCYFIKAGSKLRLPEVISVNKEFCDCEFAWKFGENDAHGVSLGKTIPAYPKEQRNIYPRQEFSVENLASIPCEQVLGAYKVIFER